MDAYLERGSERVFAGAIAWPGWARAGKTDEAALEALVAYGPRYAAALRGTRLGFRAPARVSDLRVVERVEGTATTDFGAPDVAPARDLEDVDAKELKRLEAILRAAWRTLDAAVERAGGLELATGPRGGGRALDAIVDHVLGADASYVARLGRKVGSDDASTVREGIIDALGSAVRDGVPPSPRGGKRWTPRYFVRRSAWHVLDHAWEIEDRTPA
jgi:hypothetical protein